MREILNNQLSKILITLFLFILPFLLVLNINNEEILLSNEDSDSAIDSELENNEEFDLTNDSEPENSNTSLYNVIRIVDGDTIKVDINGEEETIRLIGINTPEVVDPRRTVECFGQEASLKAKEILENKRVKLEADSSQSNRDNYGRLLRYVYLEDGLFFNEWMIKNGYAFEYTYFIPYKYQTEFKEAQRYAQENKMGLWADGVCDYFEEKNKAEIDPILNENLAKNLVAADLAREQGCLIKGNISFNEIKIYHLPECTDYEDTLINIIEGERWFCSEDEAQAAGWRKALNCP